MSGEREFVVVSRDAVERELAAKATPRRVTEEDRKRRREVWTFCKVCHDWFIYDPETDVLERADLSGKAPSYCWYVKCVCGADRVIGYSGTTREERNRRNAEIRAELEANRKCDVCEAVSADHYCEKCDKYFCKEGGCDVRTPHPTAHKPHVAVEKSA